MEWISCRDLLRSFPASSSSQRIPCLAYHVVWGITVITNASVHNWYLICQVILLVATVPPPPSHPWAKNPPSTNYDESFPHNAKTHVMNYPTDITITGIGALVQVKWAAPIAQWPTCFDWLLIVSYQYCVLSAHPPWERCQGLELYSQQFSPVTSVVFVINFWLVKIKSYNNIAEKVTILLKQNPKDYVRNFKSPKIHMQL